MIDLGPNITRTQWQAKTCGGTGGGAPCVFPFTYMGQSYSTCVKADHSEPWCATDYKPGTTSSLTWGNCNCQARRSRSRQWLSYNASAGGLCQADYWRRLRKKLWEASSNDISSLSIYSHWERTYECPEGVASVLLGHFSFFPDKQRVVVETLAQSTRHFNAPIVCHRLRVGGWPTFGVATRVLRVEVPKLRFPEAAELLVDATPRFKLRTPSAPHVILPGWWWSMKYGDYSGIYKNSPTTDSSVDGGMQVLLMHSPILRMAPRLVFLDVGAFDGDSLLSLAYEAKLNHSVLGFEPSGTNNHLILSNVLKRGGQFQKIFRILEPDTHECFGIDRSNILIPRTCKCNVVTGCAFLAKVGLSAANHSSSMHEMGAFSSLTMETFAGQYFSIGQQANLVNTRLREGAPLVNWWMREALGRSCVDVHLLKMDVEGFEFAVLRGLEPLLSEHRIRYIFLEVWPQMLMTAGSDTLGVLQWLAYYGFVCRFLGERNPESFEQFVARHTSDLTMSDLTMRHNSFDDLFCEDTYWNDPCGSR